MKNIIIFTDVNGSIGIGRYAGPYRIATEMRKNGWQVKVIDFMMSFSNEEILEIANRYKSDTLENWVGFSSTFLMPRKFDAFNARTSIREATESGSSLGIPVAEAQQLVDNIRKSGFEVFIGGAKTKNDIDNVHWINGQGELKLFKGFDFTTSSIKYDDNDHIFDDEHLPIEIARGCIFKCSFCSYQLNGKKLWEFCKSPDIIKNELLENYTRFGTTGYMFSDDTYNDSPEKVKSLLQIYKDLPFDIEFSTYARLDLILSHPETLTQLIDSGMNSVFFGVESFNHASGKIIGKGMHPDRIKQGLLDIKKQYPELLVSTGFIAGLPYETPESLYETIEWLNNSPVDSYSFQVLSLGKNSLFGKNMEKYGYNLDKNGKWYNEHMNYDTALEIANSAEYKSLSSFTFYNRLRNLGYSVSEIKNLTIDYKDDIINRTNDKIQIYKNKILQ